MWNSRYLEMIALIHGVKVRVSQDLPAPNRGGDVHHDGQQFVIRLAPAATPEESAHRFYHEVAHIVLNHVAPKGDPRLPPPGSRLAQVVKAFDDLHEKEANDWARERWARLPDSIKEAFLRCMVSG